MSVLSRLFRRDRPRDALRPLYAAIVAEARDPAWYVEAAVPDTLDGRFDAVALVLTLVLLRLERDGAPARAPSALLAEVFVDDMDGQLRQAGIGDIVVGKHVGRMMGALGGRLTAYRAGLADPPALAEALARNLYRGAPPADDRLAVAVSRTQALAGRVAAVPLDRLLAGALA